MIHVFIDENNKCFMGELESSEYRPLFAIKKPLLFQYKIQDTFNASTAEFQYFDTISKPNLIQSRIVTMYEPDKEQARLYTEECDKMFKEVNNE